MSSSARRLTSSADRLLEVVGCVAANRLLLLVVAIVVFMRAIAANDAALDELYTATAVRSHFALAEWQPPVPVPVPAVCPLPAPYAASAPANELADDL